MSHDITDHALCCMLSVPTAILNLNAAQVGYKRWQDIFNDLVESPTWMEPSAQYNVSNLLAT